MKDERTTLTLHDRREFNCKKEELTLENDQLKLKKVVESNEI